MFMDEFGDEETRNITYNNSEAVWIYDQENVKLKNLRIINKEKNIGGQTDNVGYLLQ